MSSEIEIERLLFEQFSKPKNCNKVKITNTHSNHWRVNLYVSYDDEGLTRHRIESYSCRYNDGVLDCIPPKIFA